MILSFKTRFPWGEETNFFQKIICSVPVDPEYPQSSPANLFRHQYGAKLHTIRKSHRIKAGQILHMATGVRTKKYFQFNRDVPELQKCISTQRIDIIRNGKTVVIFIDEELMYSKSRGKVLHEQSPGWFEMFCANDGLTIEQFLRYFTKTCRNWNLIHWTKLKY